VLPKSDAFTRASSAITSWVTSGDTAALTSTSRAWTPQEWMHAIDALPRDLATTKMAALDRAFHLSSSPNAEIAHVWYRLAIAAKYDAAFPAMERYLLSIGRRKLIVPLYRDLAATPSGKALAERIYAKARPGYHPLAVNTLDQLFKK